MPDVSLKATDIDPLLLARLACGRISRCARAIVEAHDLGFAEGPHESPWESEFQVDAVPIFATSLPASYQLCAAEFFHKSSQAMANETIPGSLATDWAIVRSYLDSASTALTAYYAAPQDEPQEHSIGRSAETAVGEYLPMVVRFDLLAQLATREGARHLERAAVAARDHMEDHQAGLDDVELEILIRLNAGAATAVVAAELGYSERTVYRMLARVWQKLGVPGRTEGMRNAIERGLLS